MFPTLTQHLQGPGNRIPGMISKGVIVGGLVRVHDLLRYRRQLCAWSPDSHERARFLEEIGAHDWGSD